MAPRIRGRWRRWALLAAALGLVAFTTGAPPAVTAGEETYWLGADAVAQPATEVGYRAVALSDGRVLAAAGQPFSKMRSGQAALYDPLTDAWLAFPHPEEGLDVVAITALPDGGALVMISGSGDNTKNVRYRYNGTGWIPLGEPKAGQGINRTDYYTHTALDPPECGQSPRPTGYEKYPCGAVLLAGGHLRQGQYVQYQPYVPEAPKRRRADLEGRSAQLYYPPQDPNYGDTFRATPSLGGDRPGHADALATRLDDGRVLVAGGWGCTVPPIAEGFCRSGNVSADIFDPVGGTTTDENGRPLGAWVRAADLPSRQLRGWSLRLHDGRVAMSSGTIQFSLEHWPKSERVPVLFDPMGDDGVDGTEGAWTRLKGCPPPAGQEHEDAAVRYTSCGGVATVAADGTVLAIAQPYGLPMAAWLMRPDPDRPANEWTWELIDSPPMTAVGSSVLLDGPRCGRLCGNVLVSGGRKEEAPAPLEYKSIGEARLFEGFRIDLLSTDRGFTCGGRRAHIEGKGLSRVTAIRFGAASVTPKSATNPGGFTVSADGRTLSLATPPHPPGVVPVTVSTAGTPAQASYTFTYEAPPAATVTSLSVTEGRWDRETPVTIAGSFPAECVRKVAFGDAEATAVTVDQSAGMIATQVSATSPRMSGGAPAADVPVPVRVMIDPGPPASVATPLREASAQPAGANRFTYLAPPAVTSVDRASARGGTTVAITGTGFEAPSGDTSPPQVSFDDGISATPATRISATRLETKAPPLPDGAAPGIDVGRVSVTTAKRGASAPAPFAYHPGVVDIAPSGGVITGGELRTITGRGIHDATEVHIGGQGANIVERGVIADAEPGTEFLVVSTPPREAPESVPVVVVAAGLASLETIFFAYDEAPPVEPPSGDPDPGPTNRPNTTPQAAPPGGTGSPAPSPGASASPTPTPSPVPGASGAPGASGPGAGSSSASASASTSAASAQAPSSAAAQSPAGAGAAGAGAAPAPGPAAAPASAAAGTGSAGSGGQAGAGSDDEADQARTMPRHNMTAANIAMGLGGAGAAMCFSGLALARRRRAVRSRPRPRGAY